ncbi:MFS-type transporter SLC18B1-like [Argonauta hians]
MTDETLSEKEPLLRSSSTGPMRERLPSDLSLHSELSTHSVPTSPQVSCCGLCPSFITEISRKEKLTVLFMCCITLVQSLCFSVLAPFFPAEAQLKGLSPLETGMIFGAFELMIFLTAPFFGAYLTKFGIKFTYIAGCLSAGICTVIFGFLKWCPPGYQFLLMCFLARSVEAVSVSAYITASLAVVAYIFKERASLAVGFMEIFNGVGMMAGPPIGGVLYELGGFGLPFWALGGVTVVLAFFSAFLMPPITDDSKPNQRSKLAMVKCPYIFSVCFLIVCSSYCITFIDPTLSLHLSDKLHISSVYIGLIFLAAPATYTFSAPLIGWINDTYKQTNILIIVGTVLLAGCNLFIGPAPFINVPYTSWSASITLAVLGIIFSVCVIPTFSALLKGAASLGFELDYGTVGTVSGLFNSCFSLGAFVGPFAGGALTEKIGFEWASTVGSAVILLAGLLLLVVTLLKKNLIIAEDTPDITQTTPLTNDNQPEKV